MRKFLERAIKKIPRMNNTQLSQLLMSFKDELVLKDMVMDSLTQGLLVSDKEDRIVYTNKALERLLPLHNGDHTDLLVWSVIKQSDVFQFVKETLYGHETVRDRIFMVNRDNRTIVLSISITPLVNKGQIHGNVILVADVTDAKEKEIKLKRAENLASLTTMAAGVAHEIKNPLGSMSIHIQLMNKLLNRDEFDRDKFENFLGIISDEVDRLNSIVVDYLFAVRPMNVELVESNINKTIEELIDFTKFELEESNISIELDLDNSINNIYIDSKFIKQAFLNIIKNAKQAMKNGGILKIRTVQEDNMVQVSIADNGIGMTTETQNKIFEPHFTTKETGSGLGLTLVYKIIKEHKGDISVVSQKGEGTVFNFIFPGIPGRDKVLLDWE
ncbi:MAG: hypothetical protein B6229_05475 [Spirochaetaceae bacterium 4572_7]|nr:MAG: hypothetical protein B6229_05475 [Spirochaetaceae bacterium 4572_7]